MKFKFGDKVEIKKDGFYKGTRGVIVGFDEVDSKYEVQLDFSRIKSFYAEHLKRAGVNNAMTGGRDVVQS